MSIFKPNPQKIPPPAKPRPITELLSDIESLLKLSDNELKVLLSPYFPAVRAPVLPKDKADKIGLELRVLRAVLADPRMAADLAKLKKG